MVADEVRSLAMRTQKSTLEIQQIITRVQAGASEAAGQIGSNVAAAQHPVQASARAGQALERITLSAATVSQMAFQIASASEEQAATADEINRSITRIHDAATSGTRTLQQTSDACEGLKRVSRHLQEQVAKVLI